MNPILNLAHTIKNAKADATASDAAFDSAKADFIEDGSVFDAISRSDAADIIQGWTETDDLDEGESMADRLVGTLCALVDENGDEDISEDEQEVLDSAFEAAYDYLAAKGVSDEDAEALLEDVDAEAGDRVADMLRETLPDGEEAELDSAGFAFGLGTDATFDAIRMSRARRFKGKNDMGVKHGKKHVVTHRAKWRKATVSQRAALKKNSLRSRSSKGRANLMKSHRTIRRMGGFKSYRRRTF